MSVKVIGDFRDWDIDRGLEDGFAYSKLFVADPIFEEEDVDVWMEVLRDVYKLRKYIDFIVREDDYSNKIVLEWDGPDEEDVLAMITKIYDEKYEKEISGKIAQDGGNAFHLTLKGFDVTVQNVNAGDGFCQVVLNEAGNTVYSVDIPIDLEHDDELLTEEVINYAAQAAIDLFESQRGTLGQGAGALEIEAMKKTSCWLGLSCDLKDALDVLKGTAFEDQAFALVQQIVELDYTIDEIQSSQNPELQVMLNKVCRNLTLLELELIRSQGKSTKVIVIQGIKKYALSSWELEDVQNYLDLFIGSSLENKALSLVQEYLNIKRQMKEQETMIDSQYDQRQDLVLALNNLVLENLQNQVEVRLPDFGVDAFPKATQDVIELMENVQIEEPSVFGGMWANKKSFHEDPTDTPIERLPAPEEGDWNVDYKRKEYQIHDKVTLKEDLVVAQFGEEKVVPKGTEGKVNGLFDKQDNCLYIWYSGFGIFRTPVDILSE